MRASTIDNKLKTAINLLKQNYNMAELCGWYLDLLIAENKKAWTIINKCPRYTRSYLAGVESMLRESINSKLEFCYIYKDEKYSTYKNTKHKPINLLHDMKLSQSDWDNMQRGHFWIKTGKLYY